MYRLPLFPLPVVLFPGAVMPLHIFEPRYRQMVAHCVEADSRFGLLYHDPDQAGPFQVEEGRVGCVAEILEFQPLPDGRSLVLTQGRERFRLEDGIDSDAMYYEGLVDEYQDTGSEAPDLLERRHRSIRLLHRVIERFADAPHPVEIDPARETSFQLAQLIRVDPTWQQELLTVRGETARLDQVDTLLQALLDE
jgi:Lon protease-like protein